jgi:hypothetical protein
MHFEHLVLRQLDAARHVDAWSTGLQAKITAITGDDAAMSVLGVGADFKEFKELFAPRLAELARDVVAPLDELSGAIARSERELTVLRSRQSEEMASMWDRYKPDYERYLRPGPVSEGQEPEASEAVEDAGPALLPEENAPASESGTESGQPDVETDESSQAPTSEVDLETASNSSDRSESS